MSLELGYEHRYLPGTAPQTILALHGTGGSEDDLVPVALELLPGAHVLSPRGPVLEQGMPRFFRRVAVGVFDEEDLRRRAQDLAGFVAAAAVAYHFEPSQVYALGYSNGANIAAAVLLLHPRTLAGAALLRPVLPLEPDQTPRLDGVPVLIAAGTRDPYSPRERVEALAERLRAGNADVSLLWQEGGHELATTELATVRDWFSTRLAKG